MANPLILSLSKDYPLTREGQARSKARMEVTASKATRRSRAGGNLDRAGGNLDRAPVIANPLTLSLPKDYP